MMRSKKGRPPNGLQSELSNCSKNPGALREQGVLLLRTRSIPPQVITFHHRPVSTLVSLKYLSEA